MKAPIYLKLEADLRKKIHEGVLAAGQKLPSVRGLAQERGLGKITVLRAYEDLKAEGLIEAHERSGYFVRARGARELPDSPLVKPTRGLLDANDLRARVVAANRDPANFPFGGASLALDLLPRAELRSCWQRAARQNFDKILGYETVNGMPELRRECVRHSTKWGGHFTAEECLITSGGTEAIAIALQCVTKPGDRVAVESPTYFGILSMLRVLKLEILEIPTDPRTGVDVDLLEKSMREGAIKACVLIPNFQNPLGCVMPDSHKERVATLARQRKFPVIECDTSGDLFLSGKRPRPIGSFDHDGYVITVRSFSKMVAPGFRIAYLLPGKFTALAHDYKRTMSLATASGPQLALALFLREGGYERHLRKLRRAFHQSLPRWTSAVRGSFPAGTKVADPGGGYLLWVQLPDGVTGRALWQRAVTAGISVTPGELFSSTGKYGNYVRLNCGMALTEKALRKIGELGRLVKVE